MKIRENVLDVGVRPGVTVLALAAAIVLVLSSCRSAVLPPEPEAQAPEAALAPADLQPLYGGQSSSANPERGCWARFEGDLLPGVPGYYLPRHVKNKDVLERIIRDRFWNIPNNAQVRVVQARLVWSGGNTDWQNLRQRHISSIGPNGRHGTMVALPIHESNHHVNRAGFTMEVRIKVFEVKHDLTTTTGYEKVAEQTRPTWDYDNNEPTDETRRIYITDGPTWGSTKSAVRLNPFGPHNGMQPSDRKVNCGWVGIDSPNEPEADE